MKRFSPLAVFAFLLVALAAAPAHAQSVSLKACQFVKLSNCAVTNASTTCPNSTPGNLRDPSNTVYVINAAGQLACRRYVTMCVSKNATNTSTALVTVRPDGTTPTTAATDTGTVLAVGDCISFPVSGNYTPRAIATVNPTYVTVTECY